MRRAIIIVRGRVQKVGYKDFVAEIANGLDIGGRTKNLPDGTVKIIAEAEEDVLKKFTSLIQPPDDPMIKVTGVDATFEEATNEFEYFDVEYEDFDKEGFERIGVAAVHLKRLDKGQNKMLDKQDQMLNKQDQTIGAIDKLDVNVDRRFDNLDVKYGKIAENMEKILEEMKEERKEARKSMESILHAILKLAEKSVN